MGFESLADPHKVHHVLLYGCEEPGSQDPVWDCGEMSPTKGGQENRYSQSPICQTSPNILYAWAKGAPKFELPKGKTKTKFCWILKLIYFWIWKSPIITITKKLRRRIPGWQQWNGEPSSDSPNPLYAQTGERRQLGPSSRLNHGTSAEDRCNPVDGYRRAHTCEEDGTPGSGLCRRRARYDASVCFPGSFWLILDF